MKRYKELQGEWRTERIREKGQQAAQRWRKKCWRQRDEEESNRTESERGRKEGKNSDE